MKDYKLIAFVDLMNIAKFCDEVNRMFPVDSIESLKEMKIKSIDAMTRVLDAGNEGQIHAKLDAIVESLEIINGRSRLAEEVSGPPVVPTLRLSKTEPRGARRVPQNIAELEADLNTPDLEFDGEGGGVE